METSTFAIFAAGVLTFASPCVLPLMPVYLATIAGGSLEEARPRRTVIVASAFVLGLSSVFVALGALASSFGAALTQHRSAITLASGALMVLFGVHTLGVFRVQKLERDVRPALLHVKRASTLLGAFVFGGAFALGWSPCIGPVLASVLSYAAAHGDTPARGALYLAVYAAGLALPLLALAFGAGHASAFVRNIRGMIPKLERITGLALLGVGAWTLSAAVIDMPGAQTEQACETASGDAAGHTCALGDVRADEGPLVVAAQGAQFLEFSSHDCPVCRRMRPVVEKLAAACSELDARIVRVDVNTASGRALADRYHVHGTPTFVLINEHGVEQIRLLGESTGEQLAAAVEQAFGVSCWT